MINKVSGVILINEKDEFLLYLRDNKPGIPFPNCWDIIGGHFEQGENAFDALKREVHEEIGLEIEKPFNLQLD